MHSRQQKFYATITHIKWSISLKHLVSVSVLENISINHTYTYYSKNNFAHKL